MTDQNHSDEFNQDVSWATGRHQEALRKAEEVFDEMRTAINAEFAQKKLAIQARFEQARDAYNAILELPEESNTPKQVQARRDAQAEFLAAKDTWDRMEQAGGPDYSRANAHRAVAEMAADQQFQRDLTALRTRHNVVQPAIGNRR